MQGFYLAGCGYSGEGFALRIDLYEEVFYLGQGLLFGVKACIRKCGLLFLVFGLFSPVDLTDNLTLPQ